MGTNEYSQPASKSSWDSQDFGDVNMVVKMAHFHKSSRPQWVKQSLFISFSNNGSIHTYQYTFFLLSILNSFYITCDTQQIQTDHWDLSYMFVLRQTLCQNWCSFDIPFYGTFECAIDSDNNTIKIH